MTATKSNIHGAAAVALLCVALSIGRVAWAQTADVPYVPTPWSVVDAMLGLAKVGPGDYVIDLGSGDGRIVITAARKYGARGFGVDIDGTLVNNAQREAQRQGVSDKVAFYNRNLFVTDIGQATVVTMYLFPQVNMRLRPRFLKELKPGTRIVSHEFDMEDWQPDAKVTLAVPDKPYGEPKSDIFLWIVPADASGKWRWQLAEGGALRSYELTLEQTFQMLEGKPVVAGSQEARFVAGRVRGEQVSVTLLVEIDGRQVRHEFNGRLAGDTLSGTVALDKSGSAQLVWRAQRTARGKFNAGTPASARHYLIAEEHR